MIVKINLPKKDCKGIYLITDYTNITSEVLSASKFKATDEYRLQLRVQAVKDSKKYQKKKIVKFSKVTPINKAVDKMIALRIDISEDLKDGTIQKERATYIKKGERITLNRLFDLYMLEKESILAKKTIISYRGFYNTWIRDSEIGDLLVEDITKDQLQKLVNKITKKRSPRTVKTLKEVLNPIFKKLFYSGEITSNPIELLKFKKFDNAKNPDLSDEQIKALYDAIYNYEVEPFRSIFVWLSTGRRVNEVLSLKWENVNIDKKTFTIIPENNKAGKKMNYELDEDLLKTLERRDRDTAYIFHSVKDKKKKMHNDTIRKHWLAILDDAGLEKIRIHDLRHIVGLKLVNAGVSLEVIASVLGHTTTAITKRYSNVRMETAAKAVSEFKKMVR